MLPTVLARGTTQVGHCDRVTTLLAAILIATGDLSELADTTVLLLLFVFSIVNVTVLVLRRDPVDHEHFKAPSVLPVLGALVCVALIVDTATDDLEVFVRAGLLLALGALLWGVNRLITGPVEDVDPEVLG